MLLGEYLYLLQLPSAKPSYGKMSIVRGQTLNLPGMVSAPVRTSL